MNFLYQIFSEDLIYALGWTVLHSLWQALAIGLLMAVGMLFFQQKSAKIRYEVAAFSLFLVFVSSLVTFLVYYETAQVTSDFTAITLHTTAEGTDQAKPVAIAATTLQSFMQSFNQHIPVVVMVWFLGACFFLFRLMGGLAYIQRIKYTNNKPAPAYWTGRLKKLSSKIRLRRSVTLVESSLATVPMVIGYIKPLILMPLGAINSLSESEVEAILAHELAHVYRNDFLINIFLSVIEVLFYFNPAVWWIAANVRAERENCCDDIAIKLCGSSLTYAKALLKLQEVGQSVPGYAMTFAGSKNQLLQRVKRILKQPRTKSNMLEKFTATCLLLVTVVLFSIGANSYNYNQALQQQQFAATMNSLMAAEEQEGHHLFFDINTEIDTIPQKKNNKQRYIKKSPEGEVQIEIEEGDISKLVIDGTEIPSNELEEYDEMIDNLIEEMEAVPKCSTPSPAPKSMPAPAPPAFVKKHTKTITTDKEDNGQTRIIIHSDGAEPTEIVLNDGQEFILIDGTRLEGGDTAVIIDEKNSFSFSDDVNAFTFSSEDFTFEVDDFTFDISNFEELTEETKEAFRKTAESFEEVMTLRKKEMQEMFDELKHQQEAINLQLQELHQQKSKLNRAPQRDLKEKTQGQKNEEQKLDWKDRRETMNIERHPRKERQRNDMDALEAEMKVRENIVREEYRWVNVAEEYHPEEAYGYMRFDDDIQNEIVKKMMEDDLIQSENNYSFELTTRAFKINGKKQAASVAKKYLNLYEQLSGHKMNCCGKIHYRNENGRSKAKFRSSGIYYPEVDQKYTYYFFRGPESYPMKIAKPRQLEGLETLKIQLLPVNVVIDLINS